MDQTTDGGASADAITYTRVKTAIEGEPDPVRRKLHNTALNHWMTVFGLLPEADASRLLGQGFQSSLLHYSQHPSTMALGPGTRNNRRSALKALAATCEVLRAQSLPTPPRREHPYWREIASIIAEKGMRYKDVRRLDAARRHGYLPKSVAQVEKLAARLGVPAQRLTRHLWVWTAKPLFDLRNPAYKWNDKLRDLVKLPYILKELPPAVKTALRPYMVWRTTTASSKLRLEHLDGTVHEIKRKGGWSHDESQSKSEDTETQAIVTMELLRFFGFASLPRDGIEARERGFEDPDDNRRWGLGIPLADLRLAHFLLGDNLVAYCDFQQRRQGTYDNNGLQGLRQKVYSLIGTAGSYARNAQVRLLPDFWDVLGDDVPRTPEAWVAWCQAQCRMLDEKIETLTNARTGDQMYRQSRSPKEALRFILERPRPMEEVVWPTVFHLADNRPPKDYGLCERLNHEFKVFTLASLAAEPLRARNWREMCWGRHLYLKDGAWFITIGKNEFKNRRVLNDDYHSRVEDTAQPFFTTFYEIWKETWGYDPLARDKEAVRSYVHAASKLSVHAKKAGRVLTPHKPCSEATFAYRFDYLTMLWGFRVGPHAFRHLYATDWLKRYSDDFFTVAGKLNDSIKTVLREYGHLKSSDHSRKVNEANRGLADRARRHLLVVSGRIADLAA